jgi:hypothetical protein
MAGKVWMPDKEYFDQFKHPLMYPDEETSNWTFPPFNGKAIDFNTCLFVVLMISCGQYIYTDTFLWEIILSPQTFEYEY